MSHAKAIEVTNKKKPHTHFWYQMTINLVEDMVYGPFRFETGYLVPEGAWTALREYAHKNKNVYIGNLDRIVPLDKPDKGYKNALGTAYAFLARRYRMPDSFDG